MSFDSCKSLQESLEPSVPPPQTHCAMFTTKEIPEISNGRTKVHHVGSFAVVNAVMLWGAAVALIITAVAMATTEWASIKSIAHTHIGLWVACHYSDCESIEGIMSAADVPGKHYWSCNDMTIDLEF